MAFNTSFEDKMMGLLKLKATKANLPLPASINFQK